MRKHKAKRELSCGCDHDLLHLLQNHCFGRDYVRVEQVHVAINAVHYQEKRSRDINSGHSQDKGNICLLTISASPHSVPIAMATNIRSISRYAPNFMSGTIATPTNPQSDIIVMPIVADIHAVKM